MTETAMDVEVPVSLRDQDLLDKGRLLAAKLAVRDQMVADKKRHAKEAQEEIDEFDEEIRKLGEQLRSGYENRRQGDLFMDQQLAPAALAEVAKRACTCNPETPGIHDPGCWEHGCFTETPAPGTPHRFSLSSKDPDACEVCGYEQGAALHRRHKFEGDDYQQACTACGLGYRHAIHVVQQVEVPAQEPEVAVSEEGPEDDETDDETPIVTERPEAAEDEVSRKRRQRRATGEARA